MSRGGCARRGSRSSAATPLPGCSPTSSAGPSISRSPTAASTSSSRASPRTTSTTSQQAVAEMARVAADAVLIVDNAFMGEDVEEAEKLRDPSHVRNYSEAEWRAFAEAAGLRVDEVRVLREADRAAAVARPLRLRGRGRRARDARCSATAIDGDVVTLDRIALEGRCLPDGDHRRQRHAARRPGPDRLRGALPRPPQPRLRHEPRRGRDARARAARTSRACPSSTPSPSRSRSRARTRR